METLIPGEARALCRVDEIEDGDAKGFPPAPGGFSGLVAWRSGDTIRVYVNSCPHIGTPLDWLPDRFMSRDGSISSAPRMAPRSRRPPASAFWARARAIIWIP